MRWTLVVLAASAFAPFIHAADIKADDRPHIDVVFCVDCSGSMGPVIETAKQKVWAIVNQTAKAKPSPVLRIGLIGYGNATGPFRFLQLTDDLDEVYKFLNTFDDRLGGDEFVGLAVHRATDDMKWHDGRSVTIEDVQFTFDYLLKWKPPLWQPFMEVIAGSERLGDRSVRVKLKSPAATFMTISMAQITLLPKHIWERVPEQVGVSSPLEWDPTRNDGMIGSGPFKFSRFEKDVDCHVTAFREHWTGGPKLDGIHYIQAASIEQMVGGMEAGQIHMIGDGITIIEGKRLAAQPGIELLTTETGTFVLFWVDVTKPPFNNRAFRHALYHALPKKAAVEIVLGGASVPARRSPLPPLMREWIPDDLGADEYNLEVAQKYLQEAGFKRQGRRLIAPS